jgi:hypothetical protein
MGYDEKPEILTAFGGLLPASGDSAKLARAADFVPHHEKRGAAVQPRPVHPDDDPVTCARR